jgi:hypothetical protein
MSGNSPAWYCPACGTRYSGAEAKALEPEGACSGGELGAHETHQLVALRVKTKPAGGGKAASVKSKPKAKARKR